MRGPMPAISSGARTLATKALETGRAGSLRARALLLLGSLASYTETMEARIDYHERALAEAGDDSRCASRSCWRSSSRSRSIRTRPCSGLTKRSASCANVMQQDRSPGHLISKFIAEAVLGRGASTRLLDEALALEAGSTGPVSTYPLLWFHWIDDLEATRARYRLHDERYRDRGDVVAAAEIVEFLAMAEFRAGNWAAGRAGARGGVRNACPVRAPGSVRRVIRRSVGDRCAPGQDRSRSTNPARHPRRRAA